MYSSHNSWLHNAKDEGNSNLTQIKTDSAVNQHNEDRTPDYFYNHKISFSSGEIFCISTKFQLLSVQNRSIKKNALSLQFITNF